MKLIEAPTLATAHERIIKYILESGYYQYSEDKEHTVETDCITAYIDTPFRPDRISKYAPQQEMAAKEYARQLIEGSSNKFDYTYHDQLFKWHEYHIHGIKKVHNQVRYIIDKLTEAPETRRAVAIVFDPMKHQYTDESVPCLQMMQLLYRGGRLHMRTVFRSNDMLTASGLNMYALTQLQKYIADELDYNIGSYTHIVLTPHIYYIRDSKDMLKMADGIKVMPPGVSKFPDNLNGVVKHPEEESIKIQRWILDNIDTF